MENRQVRAIAGARVSHVQGSEKTSHLDQHETGAKYTANQGWDLVGSFEDLDVSALNTSPWDRPDLGPWLNDRAHEWDALVVAKTDRLFRSAKDATDLAHWAEQNNKILVMVDDGLKLDFFHPQDEQDPFAVMLAKIFLILSAMFAELEGRRFVQRAQSRVRFLRPTDRWGWGIAPYTHIVIDHPSGTGKALALNPVTQPVVHDVVERRLLIEDQSMTNIAVSLNDEKVLTPRDQRRVERGEKPQGESWTVNQLMRILTSLATQGIKLANGKPVLDDEGRPVRVGPPTFSGEVWDQLQGLLKERSGEPRKRRHSTNPLLGVGKCGECGASLRQRSQTTPAGKTHRYYVCGRSPKACLGVSIRADDAEEIVAQTFLEDCGSLVVLRRVFQPGEDHSYELAEVEQTIESLREDRALGLFSGPEDEARYRDQMRALIARRDVLRALPSRVAGWIYEPTGTTYAEDWASAEVERRRKLLTEAGVVFRLHEPNQWAVEVPDDMKDRMRQASSS
ncbi:recombinase family protein [Amycolatopsis minnesotensis]|uniref:Recombinase domain-containing protein n=1 Tax=Amycolatopsis minnesotensis TaxID=337894 RepID=A0ABN2Q393_9PSEU